MTNQAFRINQDCVYWYTLEGELTKAIPIDAITEINIPSVIDGTEIRTIGEKCFYSLQGVSLITIPNSVKRIERRAFARSSIETISIPDSIEYIAGEAFHECSLLRSVQWSSNCPVVPHHCFDDCTALASIVGMSDVASLSCHAFDGCESLDSITFEKIKRIAKKAFSGCVSLNAIKGVSNVEVIGASAFARCESLKHFDWPDNCPFIPENCFNGCTSLTEVGNLGPQVYKMGCGAFSYTGISSLDLTETQITFVSTNIIRGCKHIKSVKLPYYAACHPKTFRGAPDGFSLYIS